MFQLRQIKLQLTMKHCRAHEKYYFKHFYVSIKNGVRDTIEKILKKDEKQETMGKEQEKRPSKQGFTVWVNF